MKLPNISSEHWQHIVSIENTSKIISKGIKSTLWRLHLQQRCKSPIGEEALWLHYYLPNLRKKAGPVAQGCKERHVGLLY